MEEKQKVRLVKTITTALAILAIIIVVSGYGLQTGSLVALIGVAGLSLSLSVQGLLSNFFSGCVLPITKPFREGDVIEAGGSGSSRGESAQQTGGSGSGRGGNAQPLD